MHLMDLMFHPKESRVAIWYIFSMLGFPWVFDFALYWTFAIDLEQLPISPCLLFPKGGMALQLLALDFEGRDNNWHVPPTVVVRMITLRSYNTTSTVIKGYKLLVVGYDLVALICLGKLSGLSKGLHSFCPLAYWLS